MRCPKCQYISFDGGDRCRNCGYEFTLAAAPESDLPMREDEPLGPMADLTLADPAAELQRLDRSAQALELAASAPATPIDLPLFRAEMADRARVVASGSPRAPLAVRRATLEIARPAPRPRREPAEPRIDRQYETPPALPLTEEAPAAYSSSEPAPASAVRRILAALIDLLIVGSLDLVVVYLTLKLTDLPSAEIRSLPLAPLTSFLLLLAGGYSVLFTAAAGQTIGKMATSIQVRSTLEPADAARERGVPLGFAILRTLGYVASLLPAGLGFLPALISTDRRALHDRLAETRVVRIR